MSKIPKESSESRQEFMKRLEYQKGFTKKQMINSAMITFLIAALFLVVSFLFNGLLISSWVAKVEAAVAAQGEPPKFITILDIAIKSLSVIFFFFFCFISIGNLQEARGYIMTWKEMVILGVLSLFQASINWTVFLVSFIGVALILGYVYLIQLKMEKQTQTEV